MKSDLNVFAEAGELRPVAIGDTVMVRDLGPLAVVAVADNLSTIEAKTPDGFGFVVFTDAIETILRRAS